GVLHRRTARVAGAGPGRVRRRGAGGERAHPGGQSGDASRTHHGARGDGVGILRPASGNDRTGRGAEAAALRLGYRLHLLSVRPRRRPRVRAARLPAQACRRRLAARHARDVDRQDARVPRAELPGCRADAGSARWSAAVRVGGHVTAGLGFDVAHMLAGGLVLASFAMLYQDRLYALINVLALHALILAASVAWQAYTQHAPHLYVTAALALGFKAIVIPMARRRMVFSLGIHREIETGVSIGLTMLAGIVLGALSLMVMLGVTAHADPVAREDIALALSVVLIGLLLMVTRRNAVSQVAGFLSLENGVNLAATGAQGMPLVVEISVAFSILIAFIVIGIFLFRIRERFDTVDLEALDQFRGERQ